MASVTATIQQWCDGGGNGNGSGGACARMMPLFFLNHCCCCIYAVVAPVRHMRFNLYFCFCLFSIDWYFFCVHFIHCLLQLLLGHGQKSSEPSIKISERKQQRKTSLKNGLLIKTHRLSCICVQCACHSSYTNRRSKCCPVFLR